MAKYVMALDQGTTSSRCILFNEKGILLAAEIQAGLQEQQKFLHRSQSGAGSGLCIYIGQIKSEGRQCHNNRKV